MTLNQTIRNEDEIFKDLENICSRESYLYAIAYFCLRDNTIKYKNKFSKKEVLQQFNPNRLVRTEISTLIGLAFKKDITSSNPSNREVIELIKTTEELLSELHFSMLAPDKKVNSSEFNISFPSIQNKIKESVFYSGEGSYIYQYKEFSKIKFENDSLHLTNEFGFNISQAHDVFEAIERIHEKKINNFQSKKKESKILESLEFFKFTLEELIHNSKKDKELIKAIINKFTCNKEDLKSKFNSLISFNPYNAFPIFELEENTFLCFQIYSLYEALYESPVFLLNENKKYSSTALKNRGYFTENFCFDKLKSIFGKNRVFSNIEIVNKKNEPLSEIDILVLYGDIAIIVQAKSKRLTIESRKGNLSMIQKDFKLAIQDAYDQASKTAISILNPNERYRNSKKESFEISNKIRKVYPIILLSDYYPSLSIQIKEFLKIEVIEGFSLPVITEIFTLDIICEFLSSPLYFLSYIDRRANYFHEIHITHELTTLSVHLTQNLWIEKGYHGVYYTEDCTSDLDAAVLARKYDLPGNKTPIGILTKFKGTLYQKIIDQLDHGESIQQIELGLFLLKLSEDSILDINSNLNLIFKQTLFDNGTHDFSLVFEDLSTGITFHTSFFNLVEANQILDRHCVARKYKSRIDKWFGIHIHPTTNNTQIINYLDNKWAYSIELERLSKDLKLNTIKPPNNNYKSMGRNSLCACGSGKKYKKCCL